MSPQSHHGSSASPGEPGEPGEPGDAAGRHELRHRLRALGLPLVLERSVRRRSLLARTFGIHTTLAVLFVAVAVAGASMDTLLARDFEFGPEAEAPPLDMTFWLAGSVAAALASPLLGWLAAFVLRFVPRRWRNPVGVVPIAVLVVAPSLIGSGSNPSVVERLLSVALILAGTYWGVGTITSWAARRALRELETLGPVVSRVLPVLMLTVLFFFFNAEIWQVAAKLDLARTLGLAGVLAAMALLLTTVTNRDEIGDVVALHRREHGDGTVPLRRAERTNILLVTVLVTMMQFALVAGLVFVFFVLFGALALPDATAQSWMNEPPKRFTGILAAVPVSTALVKVCTVLAAFSALNFVATASADRSYRLTFIEPTMRDIREGLEVREAYLQTRREPDDTSDTNDTSGSRDTGTTTGTTTAHEASDTIAGTDTSPTV